MASGDRSPYHVAMTAYVLKLYHFINPNSFTWKERGKYEFEAAEDLTAVKQARADYAEPLAECDYAMLSEPNGRLVWEQGSPLRA
jgi:hypothetical protein